MNILLISTSFFKDGEYYKDQLFAEGKSGKFFLVEERRGYGVGAMVAEEYEREISKEHAVDILRAATKSTNLKMNLAERGTLVVEVEFYED